jgi:peptidoglycan/xylan/chitin deacetylase (PgdA/CDA1 family)
MQRGSMLRRTIRSLSSMFSSRVPVLQYHRVAELPFDPYALCVTPQHFADHLVVLRSLGRPTSLDECSRALQGGKLPRLAFVVTFDDGYADCLYGAKPVLERYDVPATVFVVSGSVGSQQEFWWDELEWLLLQPGRLPRSLHLVVNGERQQWTLDEAANYSPEEFSRNAHWHYGQPDNPTSRHRLFRVLYGLLQPLAPHQRQSIVDDLRAWAGGSSKARPAHRTLSPEEVIRLAEGQLVEVGAHTVSHPMLSALPLHAQQDEIRQSKTQLEEILGARVGSFSYPHGMPGHYTEATATVVREAGFACACSSRPGTLGRETDPFQIPRLVVQDWDGETFERRMKKWIRE